MIIRSLLLVLACSSALFAQTATPEPMPKSAATDKPPTKTSTATAEHYRWGGVSDGWHLLKRDDLSVIQERVPPGGAEVMHYHKTSRQFFYVVKGEAVMALAEVRIVLRAGEGLEIPPGVAHQLRNESTEDVHFLVVSMPRSHGDKFTAE